MLFLSFTENFRKRCHLETQLVTHDLKNRHIWLLIFLLFRGRLVFPSWSHQAGFLFTNSAARTLLVSEETRSVACCKARGCIRSDLGKRANARCTQGLHPWKMHTKCLMFCLSNNNLWPSCWSMPKVTYVVQGTDATSNMKYIYFD
jgi:hypothetical protein